MKKIRTGVIITKMTMIARNARKNAILIQTAMPLNVGVLYPIAVGGRKENAVRHRKLILQTITLRRVQNSRVSNIILSKDRLSICLRS